MDNMEKFIAFGRIFQTKISKEENQLSVMFADKEDSDIVAYDLKYVIENFRTFNSAIRQLCINLIEAEDLWENDYSYEDYEGYISNAYCDTHGVCCGMSCSQYYECQCLCKG